jgi:hypothetical protein
VSEDDLFRVKTHQRWAIGYIGLFSPMDVPAIRSNKLAALSPKCSYRIFVVEFCAEI